MRDILRSVMDNDRKLIVNRPSYCRLQACKQALPLKWRAIEKKELGEQFRNESRSPYLSTARHFNRRAYLQGIHVVPVPPNGHSLLLTSGSVQSETVKINPQ